MELLGRWWNSRWGRLARRDIWLYRERDAYLVRARSGDSDSPVHTWTYACEPDARAQVNELIGTGGDGWTELTSLYRTGSDEAQGTGPGAQGTAPCAPDGPDGPDGSDRLDRGG